MNKLENYKKDLLVAYQARLQADEEMTERKIKNRLQSFEIIVNDVLLSEKPKYLDFRIDWKKSKVYGYNPKGKLTTGDNRYSDNSVSGCGYDKLSACLANLLNYDKGIKKALIEKILTSDKIPFGVNDRQGQLPLIEDGTGESTIRTILNWLGYKLEDKHNTDIYDYYFYVPRETESEG